jgi:tetratricopeptide (TPR) repeat protein
MLGRAIAGMEGLQWLLGRLDVGWAAPKVQARAWIERGAALEREDKYQEALQAYEKALELAPEESAAHLGVARAHERLGQGEEALQQLEEAAEQFPEDAEVRRQLGRLQCLSGDVAECVTTLEQAVELDPDNPQGHYWLGLGYQQGAEDGLEKAFAQYREALRADPELGRAHLALGALYRTLPGSEALAYEAFRAALDVALESGDQELAQKARSELASLYYAQGRYELCIEEWQQVLEEDPDNEDAHRRLGLCYGMRGTPEDLERAVAELETALVLDFQLIDAYYFYLGQYYVAQEQYPRAFFAWDQFLRLSQDEERKAYVRQWMEAYQASLAEGEP